MYDLIKGNHRMRDVDFEEMESVISQERNSRINYRFALLVAALYFFPIFFVIFGAVHVHDCPADERIAISLIVMGVFSFVARLMNRPYEFWKIFHPERRVPKKSQMIVTLNLIFQLIAIGAFFAACYLTLTIKPVTNPEDEDLRNYCASGFYYNIYWLSILGLTLFSLIAVGACCAIGVMMWYY